MGETFSVFCAMASGHHGPELCDDLAHVRAALGQPPCACRCHVMSIGEQLLALSEMDAGPDKEKAAEALARRMFGP